MTKEKKITWFRRVVLVAWVVFLMIFLGVPGYIYAVRTDAWGLFGGMPSIQQLENPENDLSSELFTADGVSLGKYFRYNRSQVQYEDLSKDLVNTLLLSEDHRFENHAGLDFIAYMRVLKGLVTFNYQGGGSTITQQVAKNLFDTRGIRSQDLEGSLSKSLGNGFIGRNIKKIIAKTKEWIIAVKLETTFTKEEIIALYLNTVEFSSNAYGIKAAAETYFNKTPDSLNVQESAVLVGMQQGITRYNPFLNPEASTSKRNEVLYKLYNFGYLTREEYDSIKALPIELDYEVTNQNTGLATYFRSVVGIELREWANENGYDLYEGGLKIYTTIDSRLQGYAEQAITGWLDSLQGIFIEEWDGKNPWVDEKNREIKDFIPKVAQRTQRYRGLVRKYGEDSDSVDIIMNQAIPMTVFSWGGEIDTLMSPMDSIRYYKKFLQAGFMAMDPYSGQIRAWVGGIDHKYFKYDHVKKGKNQPGSTFKPIVYATAMENGYYPCYPVEDAPKTYIIPGNPKPYRPKNSSGKFSGETMTIRKGMAQSKNSVTVHIMNLIGPQNVVNTARKMGIDSDLAPVLSLALGVSDVSLYELVGAYSTFVNKGTWTEPYYITKIEDKYGNVLQDFVPKRREALSEESAYLMLHMLKGAVEEEGGTGRRLDYYYQFVDDNNEIGAKTGTTQNYSDGWFVGVTKDLVAGAWVGGDDRAIHFPSITWGQGARMALPIWADFMSMVYEDTTVGVTRGPFERPRFELSVELDCSKYGFINQLADSLEMDEPKIEELTEDDIF